MAASSLQRFSAGKKTDNQSRSSAIRFPYSTQPQVKHEEHIFHHHYMDVAVPLPMGNYFAEFGYKKEDSCKDLYFYNSDLNSTAHNFGEEELSPADEGCWKEDEYWKMEQRKSIML